MIQKTVLIAGATSDLAIAIAHRFAKSGYNIVLTARDMESLAVRKADLEVRYAVNVCTHTLDVLNFDEIEKLPDNLETLPDIVVCAIGLLGEQTENQMDFSGASEVLRSNFEGPAHLLSVFANSFEARGHGVLVGISSVAGNRGRATNYIYGSAKAGFTAFLSGLRNRLSAKGVHVLTVLPGFVATRMTEGMDLPGWLTAQPSEVADAIWHAVQGKKNVIYVRSIWRLIMFIICAIPEPIFKKMNL